MKQNIFQINSKTCNFGVPQNSSWIQNKLLEENPYISNQKELIHCKSDENNSTDDSQHNNDPQNCNRSHQIIYELEYFLNICNLVRDDSSNQIDGNKVYECYFQQQKFHEIQLTESNNTSKFQHYHEEGQLSTNSTYQQYQNKLSGYDGINNQNQQLISYQSILEKKNYLQNIIELKFQETEKDNILLTAKLNQNIQNNLFQSQDVDNKVDFENQLKESKKICYQNVLKNIIYAFMKNFKHMKDKKVLTDLSINQFQNFRKQLVRYMKKHSFNYSVVKYLITHKIYKFLLLNFLQNASTDWLNKSKVVDKQEVLQKILFFKNCIRDPKLFDQFIIS